jgi:hypothetical protein
LVASRQASTTRAVAGEDARRLEPDAAVAAGDDDRLPVEVGDAPSIEHQELSVKR